MKNKIPTTRPGYKFTALGWIPEDWEVKELGSVATFINGKAFKQEELLAKGKYRVLRVGNFFNNNEWYYTDLELEDDKYVNNGDLMYAWSASFGPRYWDSDKTIYHYHIWKVIPFEGVYKDYLFNFFLFDAESILSNKQGGTMSHVTKGDIEKRKMILPPLPEQHSIATLLSTWDKAIEKTNQLIAKKEARKKWLMQQLLTGKKRLKGFSGEWKEVRLADCFEFIKSYSISRDGLSTLGVQDATYCIHYGDIHTIYESEFLDFSNQLRIPQIISGGQEVHKKDYLIDGDIIMADASEDYEGVGEAVEIINIKNKVVVGGLHTIVLRGNPKITANCFRAYLFASEPVRNEMRKKATGTSVYSVTKTTLQNLLLKIPAMEEQTAIANILQTVDKEIQILRTKLDKLKEQKKGLMQVLLTGKNV